MSYRIEWTSAAVRDMERLPARVAGAIVTFVDFRLADNPQRLSNPLEADLAPLRSARNGDYRVLFRLVEQAESVLIVHVDHRAHTYRPR
ncbi:type II toxin-antitoxin system RelE family toxin [Specibacter cremeus]|uniref:type II toxin-antitoxin system RelE family toxin n=1 Tax=Specibacter cremeus TaxID=1629051 RepID=UPI003B8324CE